MDWTEAVLRVALFHAALNHKTEEFLVLGSQTLAHLRDRLYCLADHVVREDVAPESYFFIEKTFYNDTRKTDNTLSKHIVEASRTPLSRKRAKSRFANLSMKKMEETRFEDLKVEIGKRYLFCHKQVCMHYLVFNEVRMFNAKVDSALVLDYPRKVFQCRIKRKKCDVCDILAAHYVTFKAKHAPQDPTYWCTQCFSFFSNTPNSQPSHLYRYFHQ